jgi:hypothetical protein
MAEINLSKYGITGTTEIVHNPSYEELFKEEMKPELEGYEKGQETELGAVNVMTGIYTGRSPKDKFIVEDEVRAVVLRDLTYLCYRMGTLNSADNAFSSCQIFKGIYRLIIRDGHILCSADVMQISMLRSDAGIIQSCRNGIYGSDLSVLILAEIGFHAVKDS